VVGVLARSHKKSGIVKRKREEIHFGAKKVAVLEKGRKISLLG
jgi:hypothetical protein